MLEFLNTLIEWLIIGGKGILGLLSLAGIIAIGGSIIAFVGGITANAIFWPIYLTKRSKKQVE